MTDAKYTVQVIEGAGYDDVYVVMYGERKIVSLSVKQEAFDVVKAFEAVYDEGYNDGDDYGYERGWDVGYETGLP